MKVIPALAAGNTVVVKPSELTPYATEHFMDLVRQAGIPAGVVNMLPGTAEAGEALVRHPLVQKISFTGGPTAARAILAACAESLKPAVLELGGKSASIVFPDADLDAVAFIATASVHQTLAGQGCALATRLVVHDSVYDELAEKVVAFTRDITLGDPFDPATGMGPVVSRAAQERILAMIDRARDRRARPSCCIGGGIPDGDLADGFYVEPTVFGDVDPTASSDRSRCSARCCRSCASTTEEEAMAIANGTDYGLASYLWTNDVSRINRLVPRLEAGGVYVNGASPVVGCELPFGGVGISGFGREGGLEGPARVRPDQGGGDRMTIPLELDGAVAVHHRRRQRHRPGHRDRRSPPAALASRPATWTPLAPTRPRPSSIEAGGEAIGSRVDVARAGRPRSAARPRASSASAGSTSS